MTERLWQRMLVAGMVTVALAAAACGGSASPTPVTTPAGSAAPTAVPSAAATTAPAGSATAAPTAAATEAASPAASEGAAPSFDLGSLTTKVSKFKSYQTSVSMTGISGAGDIKLVTTHQTVPNKQEQVDISASGQDISVITIEGKGTWMKTGSAGWVEVPAATAAQMTSAYSQFAPDALLESFDVNQLSGGLDTVGVEQKNGVAATHYRVNTSKLAALPNASAMPTDLQADLWIAQGDEYLVALELSATIDVAGTPTPMTIGIDVAHVDDPGLQVKAPK